MLQRCSVPEDAPKLAVHVRHVSKTFGSGNRVVHALEEVNLDARFGELLMSVGPSGSGKTTLLSVIAGTLRFNSGELDVLQRPLHQMTDDQLTEFRKQNIGFIFQQYHLIPTLTIVENVSIPLLLNGCPREKAESIAAGLLGMIGIENRDDARPKQLSGGQQQRVAIARALVHEPKIVICDEPTSALDAETGGQIMELLAEIASDPDRTVIVVTHDSRIFKYANRITKMDDGRVTAVLSNGDSNEDFVS